MNRRKWQKLILSLVSITVIALFYQNCSAPVAVQFSAANKKSSSSSSGGNGEGYEGKPEGVFHRYLPVANCVDKTNPAYSTIEIIGNNVTLMTTEPDSCERQNQSISIDTITYSHGQHDVIAYKDGIYASPTWLQSRPTDERLEAWCHTQLSDSDEFEMLITSHSTKWKGQIIRARRSNDRWSTQFSATFNLSRSIKDTNIVYSDSNLQLDVDARVSTKSGATYLPSQIKTSHELAQGVSSVNCRLGNDLDGMIWPAKIVTSQAYQTQFNLSDVSATYSAPDPDNGISRLVKHSLMSDKKSELLGEKAFQRILDFKVYDEFILFRADKTGNGLFHLYSLRKVDLVVFQISREPAGLDKIHRLSYDYDPVFRRVIFQEFGSLASQYLWPYIRSNSPEGDSYLAINSALELESQNQYFFVNPLAGGFYFSTGHFQPGPLYYSNGSSELTYLGQANPAPSFRLETDRLFVQLQSEAQWNITAIDLKTNEMTILCPNSLNGWQSPDGTMVACHPLVSGTVSHLTVHNRQGEVLFQIPGNDRGLIGWTSDSKKLIYYTNGRPDRHLFVWSSESREETPLSDEGVLTSLYFLSSENALYYWAWDQEKSVGWLEKVRLESFVKEKIPNSEINGLYRALSAKYLTDSGRLLFIADPDKDGINELYLMYLDGRGYRQISNRYAHYGQVTDFVVFPSETVSFQSLRPDKLTKSIFLWMER